jgi:transcriptional regulator with XRE-family HTH domain
MEHPGKQLRGLRVLAGLSQYELSKLCCVSRNRLSLFECGYCEMGDEDYKRAEKILQQLIAEKHKDLESILSLGGAQP